MSQMHNFKVTVIDGGGNKQIVHLKSGVIVIQQREQMQKYSEQKLKVSLVVFPSAKLQTRARFTTQYVETTHALIHETDPASNPSDWLGMTDQQIANKIKHNKWRIKTRKGKKNV